MFEKKDLSEDDDDKKMLSISDLKTAD